jgi:Spx/MgsR family transcriptional regulator
MADNPGMTIVYGIPNCDTVKRARAWLADAGVASRFHDFKKQGLTADMLARWSDAVGWDVLVNRKGTTWRRLDEAARAGVVDAASAATLMAAEPSLVKRPVVEWPDGEITVGFSPEAFERRVASMG